MSMASVTSTLAGPYVCIVQGQMTCETALTSTKAHQRHSWGACIALTLTLTMSEVGREWWWWEGVDASLRGGRLSARLGASTNGWVWGAGTTLRGGVRACERGRSGVGPVGAGEDEGRARKRAHAYAQTLVRLCACSCSHGVHKQGVRGLGGGMQSGEARVCVG